MIIGIGTDLIEIERIRKACSNQAFLMRCFSIREQKFIGENMSRAAGNWAVKEAVSKVFGTGVSGFDLTDIEVLRDEKGKPYVVLFNQAAVISHALGIRRLHISISNTKEYAVAYVVGEGE